MRVPFSGSQMIQIHSGMAVIMLWIVCTIWTAPTTYAQSSNPLGVNYGQLGNDLPSPEQVVELLKSTSIGKVKLYDANPAVLKAFANTNYEIIVGIGNERISALSDPAVAASWVSQNVAAYLETTKIRYICVGNEVLTGRNKQLISQLLPAMRNIHTALVNLKIDDQVRVSTPNSLSILQTSYPPSNGAFKKELAHSVLAPLLAFLSQTKSTFMVNAYPYFAYKSNPSQISLAYALFLPNPGVTDNKTGIVYSNMFGAQLDAVYSALERLHFEDIPITVSETGWPSAGESTDYGANLKNAMTYNKNLIYYISTNPGTPLKPKQRIDTYIFALFNENEKPGPLSEKHFGLFLPDGSVAYDVGILRTAPTPVPVSQSPSPPSSQTGLWCVAKPNVDQTTLAKAIDYACGEGAADCSAIKPGGICYNPNTLVAHASYAYNSYYQKHGRNYWNCYFHNSAMVTVTDPSYGGCNYQRS